MIMQKQTRTKRTNEEKQILIDLHKSTYLDSKLARINGEKVTEELFNALPFEEQWSKIYVNYVVEKKPKESTEKQVPTIYQQIRTRLTFIKNNVDNLSEEQIKKVYEFFDEIKQYEAERALRREAEEAKRLAEEIEADEAALQEKRELLKLFTPQVEKLELTTENN